VARAEASRYGAELRAWLSAGKHGSMEYLARNVEERLDPSRVLSGARSVVVVMDVYAGRGGWEAGVAQEHRLAGLDSGDRRLEDGVPQVGGTGIGKVARYARGRDYHEVMKKRLHEVADRLRGEMGGEWRAFVDTAPVLEREHAARAGLGWVGKHTLLIHPKRGSYFLLGGLLTTVELEAAERVESDHCGTCTRCIDACPTRAITPYSVDASRCISYLTIEGRGAIGEEFFGAIGEWVFGCDICQEVCPHNSRRSGWEDEVRGEYAPVREGFDVLEVMGWTEEARREAFTSSAMKRATLAMMKRNAVIVAGNLVAKGGDSRLLERVREIAGDAGEPEMVRATARAVLARLERR
jgi:epoxyqueuosine reductase